MPPNPPMYYESSYGEEDITSASGHPGNGSHIRLLTSMDEPEPNSYVPPRIPTPLAIHSNTGKHPSCLEHGLCVEEEEEVVSSCKLQISLEKVDAHNNELLLRGPDGLSSRRSL